MITEFRNHYRWLSNFAPVTIILDNIQYPSVENAYQAAKTLVLTERQQFEICSPVQAKRKGKKITLREDWDLVKLIIMNQLCTQKFEQEPYKTLLIATGNTFIQEGNYWNDYYWGVCRGKGANHLGKIIMAIRTTLQKET